MQLIIQGLKPGCRGLVIVPDGLLLRHSEHDLRRYILRSCFIEALVSLPVNTFYSTPKKTYILVVRKKQRPTDQQVHPVFSHLVSHTGETLDAKRFTVPENDLPVMAALFKAFQGNPDLFLPNNPRCRAFPISRFTPGGVWLVDKWWSLEEREKLGVTDAHTFVGLEELAGLVEETADVLQTQAEYLRRFERSVQVKRMAELNLADKRYFRLSIGKRE